MTLENKNELSGIREFNAHSSDANITVEYDDGRIVSLKYLALDTENPKEKFLLRASDGTSYDQLIIFPSVIEDNDIPVIEGNNSLTIEQNDFFATDFQVVHPNPGFPSHFNRRTGLVKYF